MNFNVEPGDIDSYGQLVGRAENDLIAGNDHVRAKATIEVSAGTSALWNQVVSQHKGHAADAEALFKGFQTVMGSSSDELIRSAQYYKDTDAGEAAQMDGTYRSPKGPPVSTGLIAIAMGASPFGGGANFSDRADAKDALASEPDPGALEQRFNGLVGDRVKNLGDAATSGNALAFLGESVGVVLDFTSPSVLVNEGLKLIFNYDLFGEVANWVAGDWGSYKQCAEAWLKLGSLCSAISTNISYGNDLLTNTWTGNAAAAAWDYFDTAAKKLAAAQETFNVLYDCYEEIAGQITSFVNMLKAGLSAICDLALMIALEAAVAAGAAATGVGLIVSAGAAAAIALKIAKAVSLTTEMATALTGLYIVIQGAQAAGQSATAQTLADIKAFPLPNKGYDHQAV
jgi:hypothetical protein